MFVFEPVLKHWAKVLGQINNPQGRARLYSTPRGQDHCCRHKGTWLHHFLQRQDSCCSSPSHRRWGGQFLFFTILLNEERSHKIWSRFFFLNCAANQRRQHQDVHPKWWFCKCLIKRKKNWKHFCIFNLWWLIGVFQGKYCPTTCGVADYMRSYILGANRDIDELQQDLDTITNLTQGTDETIQHIKDSITVAQKSSPSGERWRHKVSLVTIDNAKKKKKKIVL